MSLFGNSLNPRRRARSTNSERSRQNRKAIFIALASLAALGVFAAVVVLNKSDPIDIRTGCRLGSAIPDAHTIMLIDQTDALTEDQLYYVKTLILREYLRLNRYERFTLVGLKPLEGAKENPAPAFDFSRCRVQTGTEADSLTQSATLLTARFNQLVGKDLAGVIDGLSSIPAGENSPIMETIDNLASGALFASPQIRRRLVIVSDMAQRSPRLSQYPAPGYVFAFRDLNGLRARSSLAGMQIRAHYVLRDELRNVQTPDHRRFWAAYFKASGTDDVRIGWGLPPDAAQGNDEITPIIETQPLSSAHVGSDTWSDEISFEPQSKTTSPQPESSQGGAVNQPPRPPESMAPATIRVSTTLSRGFIRYEVNWPVRQELAFDARRVLLLTLDQPAGCYVTIPLATFPSMDPQGARVADGTVMRRVATYEPSEMDFAQRLPMLIEASVGSITFCEAVGVRVVRGANLGLRYRAVRCGGQNLQPIDDISWKQIASATARRAVRLGVVDGEHQLQQESIEHVKAGLRDNTLCASVGEVPFGKKITLGLGWVKEPIVPPAAPANTAPETEFVPFVE